MLVVKNPIYFSFVERVIQRLFPNRLAAFLGSAIGLMLIASALVMSDPFHCFSVVLLLTILAHLAEKRVYPWGSTNESDAKIIASYYFVWLLSVFAGTATMYFCFNNVCWGDTYIKDYPSVFKFMSSTPHAINTEYFNLHCGAFAAVCVTFPIHLILIGNRKNEGKYKSSQEVALPLLIVAITTLIILPAAFKLFLNSFPIHLVQVELEGFDFALRMWNLSVSILMLLAMLFSVKFGEMPKLFGKVFQFSILAAIMLFSAVSYQLLPAEFHNFCSGVYHSHGRYRLALSEIDKAIALKPKNSEFHFLRGLTCLSLGDRNSAAKSFNRSAELGRTKSEVPLWAFSSAHASGCGFEKTGKKSSHAQWCPIHKLSTEADNCNSSEQSRIVSLKAAQLEPRYSNEYCELSYIYGRLKMYRQAEKASKRAVAIYPTGARENFNLALSRNAQGKYKQAIIDSSITIALMPDNAGGYCSRGRAYYSLGRYDKALKDLNQAVSMMPSFSKALYFRSKVYENLGKHDLVKKDRKRCFRFGYEPENSIWM